MTALWLGNAMAVPGRASSAPEAARFELPAHHLVTHGVIVGMTGSGKTGLLTVVVEEAARSGVPVLVVDVKGDLPNLLLALSGEDASVYAPWVQGEQLATDDRTPLEHARAAMEERRRRLLEWGIDDASIERHRSALSIHVLTPGSTAGEPLHLLSGIERPSTRWTDDAEAARATLSAAISLILRLLGRDADPARSREHVLLSVLAERRASQGRGTDLATLVRDITEPPISELGALSLDAFVSSADRAELAAALNTLLASPTFATWRQGTSLDVSAWMSRRDDGKTPVHVVSVAHLDDEERTLVLGLLFEEVLAWVRGLPGTQRLRALIAFDETYGFLPPHPREPATKRPLVALMKQARAFGVGVVLATQNPMDLDYRSLSNAGLWCVGRLQTDADRERVIEGLATSEVAGNEVEAKALNKLVGRIRPRWFVVRDVHTSGQPFLLQPRQAISLLRGPLTRAELATARAQFGG
ncbi:MAG: helicase HerA-like domain-containing protein [Sandaracinus sp.]